MTKRYINSRQILLLAWVVMLCFPIFAHGVSFAQRKSVIYHVAQKNPKASDAGNTPGTLKNPYKSIAKALKNIRPGDVVIIHEGIYRESADVMVSGTKERPITIEAAKNEKVIMRGSEKVASWIRLPGTDPIYVHNGWTKFFGAWRTPADDARDKARNQVYINGTYIEEVPLQDSLREGTFYIDKAAGKIFLWPKDGKDPNTENVEVSDREYCLNVKADHIIVRGIHVEYGANGPQGAAMFRLLGSHDLVEDCSVQWAAGSGFTMVGSYNLVRRCVFNHNGQIGLGSGKSSYCLFEDCETSYNNLHTGKIYSSGWEAGGNKVAFAKAVNFLRHVSIGNNGPGIWYDISNDSCEVRNCFTQGNAGSGLFYEISYHLHATDNVMIGNGLNSGFGSWGANGGITLSSSPGCVVERNIMINNVDGFQFREQGRTTPRINGPGTAERFGKEVPVWNHDEIIRNNIMAFNKGAQLRGWFDVPDGRHWPAAIRATLPAKEATSASSADWAAGYQAKDNSGQPKDVTLDLLNLAIDHNCYWAEEGQAIFHWGTSWKYNVKYNNLATLSEALHFESEGKIIDPAFNDWKNLDLRVRRNSALIKNHCYPQGEVPHVKLGIIRRQ